MNRICRLCLKKCDHNIQGIEENANEISHILQEINLAISEEPEICTKCWESLKKCSNFKSTCLDVEDFIVQFIIRNANSAKPNLKYIYLSKEANGNDIPKDHDICRLCMCPFKVWPFMSLDSKKGHSLLQKMMLKCLSELDLCLTEKPVICVPCYGSLQHYFNFIMYCLRVEEHIKKYCEAAGIDGRGVIKLKDVLEFTTKIINKDDKIQMEERFCENEYVHFSKNVVENEVNTEHVDTINIEETLVEKAQFKTEPKLEDLSEIDDQQFNDVSKLRIKCEEGDDQVDAIEMKHSYCTEMVDELKIEICEEVLDRKFKESYHEVQKKIEKQNINSAQDSRILPQEETHNYNLRKRQKRSVLKPTENSSQVSLVKSGSEYTNKPKRRAPPQRNTLEKVYRCAFCSFQTKYKQNLHKHNLIHKNPLKIRTYQCKHCSFETKCKQQLKKHKLSHRKSSEPRVYQEYHCNFCLLKTKDKRVLFRHLLTHKDPSEVELYKCASCSFQTKHKSSLYAHMRIHKNPSEVMMHHCDLCSFITKYKKHLKRHLLIHKDPSEVTRHYCDKCLFSTKRRYQLKQHLLTHKDPSEAKMYSCKFCSFQTKDKSCLKEHFLVHKMMYQCDLCSYQTERKSRLNSHLLVHKDPSEVTMHHCNICSFSTKSKYRLKQHLLTHKDPSEREMYLCASCSFQTINKYYLAQHFLTHRTVYRCDLCSYRTRKKPNLSSHTC